MKPGGTVWTKGRSPQCRRVSRAVLHADDPLVTVDDRHLPLRRGGSSIIRPPAWITMSFATAGAATSSAATSSRNSLDHPPAGLEYFAAFHHEVDALQDGAVRQWIALHPDDVGVPPGLHRADVPGVPVSAAAFLVEVKIASIGVRPALTSSANSSALLRPELVD
jgi:hypothetical protein